MSPVSPSVTPLFRLAAGLELILASASPRRSLFLRQWGLPFRVCAATSEEPRPHAHEKPVDYTCRAAQAKARAVLATCAAEQAEQQAQKLTQATQSLILAADTVVAVDGRILGKPQDSSHALNMLESLNGRGHEVISAVCLILPPACKPPVPMFASNRPDALTAPADKTSAPSLSVLPSGQREVLFADSTQVFFYAWPRAVLQAYVRTGEPADKAGAYAIQGQGAFLVDRIEGSWSTVVGLPVPLLATYLLAWELMQAC